MSAARGNDGLTHWPVADARRRLSAISADSAIKIAAPEASRARILALDLGSYLEGKSVIVGDEADQFREFPSFRLSSGQHTGC